MEHKIIIGDSLKILKDIKSDSIDCSITSPPYYNLRKYTDGNPNEIGTEKTPQEYIKHIVQITTEIMRVLKPQGVLLLNLGDSFSTHKSGADQEKNITNNKERIKTLVVRNKLPSWRNKQRLLLPFRIAIQLQDKGYIIRNDIVWAKKITKIPEKTSIGTNAPMPLKDRFGTAHESIFLITKSEKYYFNMKEALINGKKWADDKRKNLRKKPLTWNVGGIKNKGKAIPTDVIMFKSDHKKKANHYATYPTSLVEYFIKIICPKNGWVIDPFLGSGTTSIIAEKTGRNSIGIELNPEYAKIAEERINKQKQQKKIQRWFE